MGGWTSGEVSARGEYRYSSLVKLKKGENYAVFYFAGKRFCFYIYEVFTSPKKKNAPDYTTLKVKASESGTKTQRQSCSPT
jgi:hypothetical protein